MGVVDGLEIETGFITHVREVERVRGTAVPRRTLESAGARIPTPGRPAR